MPADRPSPSAPSPGTRGAHPEALRLREVEAELTSRWPESHIEPSLDRIARLVELLGDPQRAYPVVHITGTNGKSSTARIAESLLRSAGLRTGLLTSPHLHSVRERIVLDGEPVDVERFLGAYDEIAPYLELVDAESVARGGPRMSFFEVITGLAYAVFADAPVDVAVVEVGMGGTWDATNVADGAVAVVTPIGLDHTDYLGPTVADIAREKAGIVKPGAVAVLAEQPADAASVLLARCAGEEVPVLREGIEFGLVRRDVAVGGQLVDLRSQSRIYEGLLLPLHGEHQAHNAAAALAAVEALLGGTDLDPEVVAEGIAAVRVPGRLEVVRRSPTVLVDAAHNPHGAAALATALDESFGFSHLVAVVGVLGDKDAAGILTALDQAVDEVVVTRSRSPRAMPEDELRAVAEPILGEERVHEEPDVRAALDTAMRLADEADSYGHGGTGVLVTGSVVTVAEARSILGAPGSRP